jgi:hypothetical protein
MRMRTVRGVWPRRWRAGGGTVAACRCVAAAGMRVEYKVGLPLSKTCGEGRVSSAESVLDEGSRTALGGGLMRILSQRVTTVRGAVSAARAPPLLHIRMKR